MTAKNAVYIMASGKHGTLYVGVTSDLIVRVSQHREGTTPGFTSRYEVKRLVWFERHDGIVDAIQREKSLKRYARAWKINLIEQDNPNWDDLYETLFAEPPGPLSHLNPGLTRTDQPAIPPTIRHPRACPEDP
ncbi:hypothetical protein BH10PSE5_BH10PSE5_30800 [soil metagenome]